MSTMPPTSADEAELRLLLRLDDDALDSVLSKLDAPHEDALFIALACKRLRAAVLRRLAPLEEAHRNTYHLLAAPVRLRTNITGGFASVARVAFVHDCDCTDQTLTAQRVPISVLFRMVQHLPWPFLRCLYFERRACRKWDLVAHPEHRALLAFAALHGRCDILDALFESPLAARNPAANPARLASTALPSTRMLSRKVSSETGMAPQPAITPSRTALICAPDSRAASSISNRICDFDRSPAACTSCLLSARPSPICIFSAVENTRCVDAISSVRSGVTYPDWIWRPVSSSSVDAKISTSPGDGLSAKTGGRSPI